MVCIKIKIRDTIFDFDKCASYNETIIGTKRYKLKGNPNCIFFEKIWIYVKNLDKEILNSIMSELLQNGYYDFDLIYYPIVSLNEEEQIVAYKSGKPFIIMAH